MAHGELNRMKN